MGLSILIPVYNVDVSGLVKTLSEQLQQTGKQGEIILLDDHSDTNFDISNCKLADLSFVKYYRNEKNEGRTASRKKLSSLADFEYLLFLDCDSQIVHENFITAYFEGTEKEKDLIVGGRIYSLTIPGDCNYRLHWKYGSRRESGKQTAFMSNNFMIKRSVFEKLDFSFQLPGYGHEDTWWGIQLKRSGIKIKTINNPVMHGLLDDSQTFLKKSENALTNLLLLEKKVDPALLKKEVRIYRWSKRLSSLRVTGLYLFFENLFHRSFYRNLVSCHPKLFYFDLYRLGILIKLSRKNDQ